MQVSLKSNCFNLLHISCQTICIFPFEEANKWKGKMGCFFAIRFVRPSIWINMGLHALLTAHFVVVCNAILYLNMGAATFVQNWILNGHWSYISSWFNWYIFWNILKLKTHHKEKLLECCEIHRVTSSIEVAINMCRAICISKGNIWQSLFQKLNFKYRMSQLQSKVNMIWENCFGAYFHLL